VGRPDGDLRGVTSEPDDIAADAGSSLQHGFGGSLKINDYPNPRGRFWHRRRIY
jgi:hypothetical protein